MVFVKVRETYDLHTTQNKMTVIGIHTPNPDILKKNFPGLLMQCKMYRPYSCDVRVACASVLPLDPLGVGLSTGDVAPEDVFNPILYKATSNLGMSQLEARIAALNDGTSGTVDVLGSSAIVDVDTVTSKADEFPVYYGLLSNAHGWRHAHPQQGLQMSGLRPLVYEINYSIGDNGGRNPSTGGGLVGPPGTPKADGDVEHTRLRRDAILGGSKPMPFINTTSYTNTAGSSGTYVQSGFVNNINNAEQEVPWMNVMVGVIIVPPSRLHEFFYRMVIEWTVEFSSIRPVSEITTWNGLEVFGNTTHYQNYSYSSTKEAVTGDQESLLDQDACMVSANVDVKKVM